MQVNVKWMTTIRSQVILKEYQAYMSCLSTLITKAHSKNMIESFHIFLDREKAY